MVVKAVNEHLAMVLEAHPEAVEVFNKDKNQSKLRTAVADALKHKALKDPDEPKKPRNAFWLYKQSLKDKGLTMTEVAEKWNDIKTNPKKKTALAKWQKEADKDKKRYTKEMAEYKAPSVEELMALECNQLRKKSKKSTLKDPEAPKKPVTAYRFYSNEHRKAFCEEPSKYLSDEAYKTLLTELDVDESEEFDYATVDKKIVGARFNQHWSEVKETKACRKYHKMASDDKKRYADEMKGYERPSDEELMALECNQPKAKRPRNSKGEKKPKQKKPKVIKPDHIKGAKSAWVLWSQEARPVIKAENEGEDVAVIRDELSRRWKKIKEEDGDEYKKWVELAHEDKARFDQEMEEWKASGDAVVAYSSVAPVEPKEEEVKTEKTEKKKGRKSATKVEEVVEEDMEEVDEEEEEEGEELTDDELGGLLEDEE